ncbi:MAG: TAXI family TRAP transporter solute-binding subunit, partial [Chloroflexi bacterium]|nr:TAXI family TRAP transporter solute-binding subunit [Chloroflexota bacterium]
KASQVQRFLYIHSVAPQGWVVRKDTNISKIEEVEGKDFTAGMKGSATEKQTQNVMAVLGVKPRYYAASIQDMVQAIKDRRIVGFVKLHSGAKAIDSAVQEVNVTLPLRELSFTPEQEKKVLEKYPYYTFMDVDKDQLAPGYPDRKVRSLALVVGVAINKDIPEELGYKLTKVSIEDNTDKGDKIQATAYPAVKGIDFAQLTVDYVMTPLHAGAVKYFREIGKQVKKEQIPPEMK